MTGAACWRADGRRRHRRRAGAAGRARSRPDPQGITRRPMMKELMSKPMKIKRRTMRRRSAWRRSAPAVHAQAPAPSGEITFLGYTGIFEDNYKPAVVEPFMRCFPGIRVNYITGTNSAQISAHLSRGQRASPAGRRRTATDGVDPAHRQRRRPARGLRPRAGADPRRALRPRAAAAGRLRAGGPLLRPPDRDLRYPRGHAGADGAARPVGSALPRQARRSMRRPTSTAWR